MWVDGVLMPSADIPAVRCVEMTLKYWRATDVIVGEDAFKHLTEL